MIIGLSGYIGSGKDEVGKIIAKQDGMWYNESSLGSTAIWKSENHWEIKKFAAKLKQIASLFTGIPVEEFEDQEFKKSNLPPEWNVNVHRGLKRLAEYEYMTVRQFLQKLGTEAIREGLHENAWVNALFADYNHKSNWIITDTRFPNEAEAIKNRGGVVVRVVRDVAVGVPYNVGVDGMKRKVAGHASEVSLDNWNFDYVIDNNGTLEDLAENVKVFTQKMTEVNFAK